MTEAPAEVCEDCAEEDGRTPPPCPWSDWDPDLDGPWDEDREIGDDEPWLDPVDTHPFGPGEVSATYRCARGHTWRTVWLNPQGD